MPSTRLALAILCMVWSAGGLAQTGGAPRVDVALVLTVDASGSIDQAEFRLQKEGIAGAVADPQVLSTIQSGRNGRVAIAYVEWGAPGAPQMVVDWMLVGDAASAGAFGSAVRNAPRSVQSYNAIGDAIDLAVGLFARCPCQPTRRIIDVSGDNPDMRSNHPGPLARDAAVAAGVTINALAILQDDRLGPGGKPWLVETYEQTIIGLVRSRWRPTAGRTSPAPCATRWCWRFPAFRRPIRRIWPPGYAEPFGPNSLSDLP